MLCPNCDYPNLEVGDGGKLFCNRCNFGNNNAPKGEGDGKNYNDNSKA